MGINEDSERPYYIKGAKGTYMRKMSVDELINSESFISWFYLSDARSCNNYAEYIDNNQAEASTVVKAKELLYSVKMNNIRMDTKERMALKDKIMKSIKSNECNRSMKSRLCFSSIIATVLDVAAGIYVGLLQEDN